jgi:hypothetical protein
VTRLYRLLSPGLSFAAIAVLVFAEGQWFPTQFRGGLTTLGLYAFAGQLLVSALLVSAIDDMSGSSPWHLVGRGSGALLRISARPVSFQRALAEFYRRPFWPVLLLAFGLAASLSTFAVGIFQEDNRTVNDDIFVSVGLDMARSEALLGTVLVCGAALLWWRGGASYFGWVIGVCLATMLGELVFTAYVNPESTATNWAGVMIGLCLFRLLALAAAHAWRTRFRSEPAIGPSRS